MRLQGSNDGVELLRCPLLCRSGSRSGTWPNGPVASLSKWLLMRLAFRCSVPSALTVASCSPVLNSSNLAGTGAPALTLLPASGTACWCRCLRRHRSWSLRPCCCTWSRPSPIKSGTGANAPCSGEWRTGKRCMALLGDCQER